MQKSRLLIFSVAFTVTVRPSRCELDGELLLNSQLWWSSRLQRVNFAYGTAAGAAKRRNPSSWFRESCVTGVTANTPKIHEFRDDEPSAWCGSAVVAVGAVVIVAAKQAVKLMHKQTPGGTRSIASVREQRWLAVRHVQIELGGGGGGLFCAAGWRERRASKNGARVHAPLASHTALVHSLPLFAPCDWGKRTCDGENGPARSLHTEPRWLDSMRDCAK